ncbi:hypothetical protein DFH07DRAFT_782753 [Mycena maculata]|uniref:Uncharacterized protein n=1 Tax=Mycena maculata TaxID=230809 RepID=A0AAD7MPL0_9AGAR|nr:hypothetical protein DFH07DRAFT_782753 [Mycena maculata]
MSTHHTDWNAPPHYEAVDDSGSHRESDTLLDSRKPLASGPRYVYYRVYALDGILRCKNDKGNPFIGRIKATSVPLPHTVASLKRALVQAEGLPDPNGDLTGLFQTRDARTAMVMNARVDILTGDLGATAHTSVALVFLTSSKGPVCAASDDEGDDDTGDELPLLYYRLYNRGGEERSVRSFDASEPALGRVKRESIAPPRNVLSVRRRIANVEGKPIYELADLFTDMTADNALHSDTLMDDTCGSSKENPVLIVQPEHRPGVYNRPVLIVALPSDFAVYSSHRFTQWLSPSPGDIVHSDGVAVDRDAYSGYSRYAALDKSGKTGYPAHSKLLDEVSEQSSSSGCNIQ